MSRTARTRRDEGAYRQYSTPLSQKPNAVSRDVAPVDCSDDSHHGLLASKDASSRPARTSGPSRCFWSATVAGSCASARRRTWG